MSSAPECTTQSITFSITAAADEAFPLFGARREMDWDPDWRPHFLGTEDVFLVENEIGTSVWVMTQYDASERAVGYVRVTPQHTVAQIWITITPSGENASRATVTYRLTGLSTEGNQYVARFAKEFPAKAQLWGDVINHYLATGKPLGARYDVPA